ncbi:ubiquinol-cytochrome C chaperone family protein [Phenylobacterium sp.]|jgi:cytochrome b pre-mRNA-processing protein 3|uniref:ubiquinol-cytochrome C chaperone family protein n=1 Tax=Phenylobacterium sp. TaxID=1871053 RepID=UPI002F40A6AF
MFLDRLFRPKAPQAAGRALYAAVVSRSRRTELYDDLGVPDTVEGRFEAYTLHVVLLLDRLRGQGPHAVEISQALFDTYVKALDDALREMGVGDLSVGRKMRKLGEAFYGRVKSYESAFAALPDAGELEALLKRTAYDGTDGAAAPRLARHIIAERAALAANPLNRICDGHVDWTAP